jgi:hypothetical protein
VGRAKGKGSACLDGKEEGRNYRGWEKETLAAYESPVGGTQKSKRKEIISAQRGFMKKPFMLPALPAFRETRKKLAL